MPAFRPCRFRTADYGTVFRFAGLENGPALQEHLVRVGAGFPSLILACSAGQGARAIANDVAQGLTSIGLNVFMPRTAVPLGALSLALANRNMPMGLYLGEGNDGLWSLLPLAGHGGPVEETHARGPSPERLRAIGVLGEADLFPAYFQALEGLLDPHPGPGPRISRLECPFPQVEKWLSETDAVPILKERDPAGPVARVSVDGQRLELEYSDGRKPATQEMVKDILGYLTDSRAGSGTVIGPTGTAALVDAIGSSVSVQAVELPGDAFEMSCSAGFTDFLLGWSEPGLIAHQGHTPFGDALLTLGYLLEARSG